MRDDITGLRAIAVIAVLLYHAGIGPFTGGFVGVDVFFVISGFLITGMVQRSHEAGKFTFSSFLLRRARRLLPALLTTVLSTFIAAGFLLTPNHMREFGGSVVYTILPLSNFYFWSLIDYFANGAITQPLLHTWTLSVEWQFYLFWAPFLVYGLLRMPRRYTLWTILFLSFACVALAEYLLRDYRQAVFFQPWSRLPEFAIGAILFMLNKEPPKKPLIADAATLAGLALILGAFFCFTEETRFPGLTAMVPCLGAALMLYAARGSRLRYAVTNPVSVYIGLISYSLYLVHWPIIVLWSYTIDGDVGLALKLGMVAASAVCGALQYHLVERPFHEGKALTAANPFLASTSAVALLAVVPAAHAYKTDGWEWRLPAQTRTWLQQSRVVSEPGLDGDPKSDRRILLIGDSHANHYAPMLSAYLKERGFNLVRPKGRCFPLPNVRRYVDGRLMEECVSYADSIIQKIRSGEYQGVVVAARWSTSLFGQLDPREAGGAGRTFFITDDQSKEKSPAESVEVFKRGVDRLLVTTSEEKLPVMLMGQFPPMGGSILGCIVRRGPSKCRPYFTKKQAADRVREANAVFRKAEERYRRLVHFFNPFHLFCAMMPQNYCPYVYGDVFLYHDDDHLNVFGSRALAEFFAPDFDRFVALIDAQNAEVAISQ